MSDGDIQQALQAGNQAEFLFYTGPDGSPRIEVLYANENVWLTQRQMSELFAIDTSVISRHIANISASGELDVESNVQKMQIANSDKPVSYYNLDVTLSVGYRANSREATAFRRWATSVLREYLIKGFVLDDERLKNGAHFGKDYFDELLERIREIRLSERRIYLKVTDIFALSSDYDNKSDLVKEFFAFIQNKLHYAVAGGTAAELIRSRADSKKDHMGLQTWKQAPDGKIFRTDVTTAKNYLSKPELEQLQLAVSAFLDIAEARARRGVQTSMAKWIAIMNDYLDLSDYPKLQNAGSISKERADRHALKEYATFRVRQDREFIGDFEKAIKKIEGSGK